MAEINKEIEAAALATERAIDELRRQQGLVIQHNSIDIVAMPFEWLNDELVTRFQGAGPCWLIVTPARAGHLGLETAEALAINASSFSLTQLRSIVDPLVNIPPPSLSAQPASEIQTHILSLVKYAGLLPAVLLAPAAGNFSQWQQIRAADLALYARSPLLDVISMGGACLPIEEAENTRLESFRARFGAGVHLALIVGAPEKQNAPLVRVHSSCVTGDILGSLRCDCGDQLKLALNAIRGAGSGVLLYLHQEGRGIGIINKLRAYRLQEQGKDTFDANLALGFSEDERDFALAAAILKKLGIPRISLLTNNPHKRLALEQAGIDVAQRVRLATPPQAHNQSYLQAKADKSGHQF